MRLAELVDVVLSLMGEYIWEYKLGGQEVSPRDKVGAGLQILNYQICATVIYL